MVKHHKLSLILDLAKEAVYHINIMESHTLGILDIHIYKPGIIKIFMSDLLECGKIGRDRKKL